MHKWLTMLNKTVRHIRGYGREWATSGDGRNKIKESCTLILMEQLLLPDVHTSDIYFMSSFVKGTSSSSLVNLM